ncbi:LacI family DNA-binding transcriptional regulator [Streptomyces beijiangensis]|uniref:DeoR/GlpR family transcriptional regulator n=1 Tax=Streptomyces beijiangensis TaxID=163361 RepID=A0A939JJS1_9ACTN|nr:substrate-binding domain-containing protein [Streptomyces beijiangensis]MBO0515057.1 DeoR/GlpR family transcriptional regulator [Streptomyces beijiangensis]
MRLHVDQRHDRVLEIVEQRGSLRVTELASELGVSSVTLRRDIEILARQGKVRRLHGTVLWPEATAAAPAPVAPPVPVPVRSGEGIVVGMVVPSTDYYFADVVRGAREAVEARGGRLTIGLHRYLSGEDTAQSERLLATGVDGLLLTPRWDGGEALAGEGDWAGRLDVPVVLVERRAELSSPAAALDQVATDHAYGVGAAVRHLAGLGHRRIALAAQESPTAAQLRSGHRAAVAALGLAEVPASPLDTVPSVSEADRFERTLDHLVDSVAHHGVTAVVVHSDADAVVLVPRLQSRGVKVPEELAVVAYDDEVADLAGLPLTAVAPPKRAVGAAAAGLLLDRIAELRDGARAPAPRRHVELLPELRVRASSGGPVYLETT